MINKHIQILALFAVCSILFGCSDSDENGCKNNQVQCSASGIPQICVNAHWQDTTRCKIGESCQNGICVNVPCTGASCQQPECIENAIQCSLTGVPQLCVSGKWTNQAPCNANQTCQSGSCMNVPCTDASCQQSECVENAGQCTSNGVPQLCVSGKWTNQAPCNANQTCQNGVCREIPCTEADCMQQPECQENAAQCSQNGIPQLCVSGKWTDQTPCNANQTCKNGICKANETTCSNSACQNDDNYKGNVCVDIGNQQRCGCETDKDCKATYICNTYNNICEVECSNQNCAAQTSDYQGNLCLTETEDDVTYSYCGCEEDTDCKSGYVCDTLINICTEPCSSAQCAAMKDGEYAGNICTEHYMDDDSGEYYITCGCKTKADCRDGYECNTEFNFCTSKENIDNSCKPETCEAMPDATYQGNKCVILSGGYGCGCEDDKDCRGEYICNYMNQCIIEQDISECRTDNDCMSKPAREYYGNICLTDYYADKSYTYCGCKKDADCKNGYSCNIEQDTCEIDG